MRVLLVPFLLSYARTVLGVPFVRDALRTVVSARIPRHDGIPELGSSGFWFHIVISVFLVLAGGLFSG